MKRFQNSDAFARASRRFTSAGIRHFLNISLIFTLLLTLGVGQVWAGTSTTVYYAVPASTVGCYKVKLNVAYEYNSGTSTAYNWHTWEMDKTAYTYNGNIVYSKSFTDSYNGVGTMQIQLYDGDTYKSQQQPYGSWTAATVYNGRMYVHNTGWVDFTHDDSYTIYFSNQWNWGAVRAYAWNSSCDYNASHPGSTLVKTGCKHNGHDIYRLTLNKRYSKIQFNCNSNDCKEDNQDCYSNRGKQFGGGEGWYDPSYDGYTFSNRATVVWDAGNESWTSAYLYHFDLDGDGDVSLSRIGSTQQFYATAESDLKTGAWIVRSEQGWGGNQTTDITSDISGVTLFNYINSKAGGKLNWQVTSDAKRATSGVKVYFDNTDAKWSSIYLKYGTQWFTRATSAATKVNGTANLYCITIPNDAYYGEYFLADAEGSVGYNSIETTTSINNRIGYQASCITSDFTYIPSTGSGTPKVWTTTTISGHTRKVTLTAPSHGSITATYKDENNADQTKTVTSGEENLVFNVAQTCNLTITSTAATGYNRTTLKVNNVAHTSGSVYVVRGDINVTATFTAKSCSVTFDKNGGTSGSDGTTATYDAAMTTISIPSKEGYTFDGYWDAETDNDGTGIKYYNANGTSARVWDKNTESAATLYAKWTANEYTITLDPNGGEGGTASVIATYDATPPTGDGTGNYYFSITNPTKPGCTFLGWFTAADGGDLVINTDGTFNAPVEGYTSTSPGNIWIHPYNATLYAHWEVVRYVIYHHGQAPEGGVEAYAGGTISLPIEYRRKFEKDTWYAIYFPFVVTAVQVFDDEDGLYYDLKPYYRKSNGVLYSRHYIIRKATPAKNMDISKFESKIGESGWLDPAGENKTDVDSWLPEKNTPYMIQFHNDYYTDKWIAFIGAVGSTIETDFVLGDAPSDSGFVNIYGNNTLHDASLSVQTYMLNYDEYEGKAWTRCDAGTTLHPFEVYMRAEAKTTEQHQVLGRRPKQEDTATAVDDIYTETSCLRVYTLTGQLLLTLYHITPDDAGRQLQQQLGQGIYILHSDHSSYKLIIGGH